MTRLQAIFLVLLIVIMSMVTVGPLLDIRRADSAVGQLELLADAVVRYGRHIGVPCTDLHELAEAGTGRSRGPYIDSLDLLETPWGGEFVLDRERGLVGLDSADERVPSRYRLGGIAELSMPVRDHPDWWPRRGVDP